MSKYVVLFFGPPCSGKSTIIKAFNKSDNFTILSNDILRHEFLTFENKSLFSESFTNMLYKKLFIELKKGILESSKNILIEGMFKSNYYRSELIKAIENSYFEPFFITCTLDDALIRLKDRSTSNVLNNYEPLSESKLTELYFEMKNLNTLVPKTNIIDTSKLSVDDCIKFIYKKVKKKEFTLLDRQNFIGSLNIVKENDRL